MRNIPEGLITKALSGEVTSFNGVLKPVFGSIGSNHAEFRMHKEYSGADSNREGREVHREVEICLIHSDRFSAVPFRIRNKERGIKGELSPEQEIKLAPLYERFKTQQESGETPILDWEAITDQEKAHLGMLNIWTVEQLHNIPEAEKYRVGPGADDLKERARRHMVSKRGEDKSELQRELEAMRKEATDRDQRFAKLEEQYLAMQMQIAEKKKKKGKPKPGCKTETPIEPMTEQA